ncbi:MULTISPECIES: CU044_5270 family protein [unclassified Nonomuraea]|uniref:CU044_5270 family protein n=1 Tax=unclassified Nonomuraea TaxID=2593643 RepID=UPI0033E02C7A
MDELNLLARSLPDAPPPRAEVVEKARARLAAARQEPVRPHRAGRAGWRGRTWGWTLGTAAATVAVVMAVVALVGNLTTAPAPPVLAPDAGADALIRLADRVARLPDDSGAYWRRPLLDNGLIRVRAGDQTFNVLYSSRIELWQPRDPGDPVQVVRGKTITRPATPADERAWQAAGSPATLRRVCAPGDDECAKVRLRSKLSDCLYTRAAEPGGVFGDRRLGELTLADLAALPDDAARLREALRTRWEGREERMGRESFDEFLSRAGALLEMPVRPSVRAAALRLLAGLPTTKVLGPAVDPLGREGLAVTFGKSEGFTMTFGADDEVPEVHATILDPRTGTVLSHTTAAGESTEGVAKGTMMYYQAWAPEAGWTGERPERPRACRLSKSVIP